MLQCLEWEPSGSFYQKRPVEANENLCLKDYSGSSGLIDMNLVVDLTEPTLPPNPRKAILYRPTVTHLLAILHGSERGEAVALLLSPSMPSFKNSSEVKQGGSQFTLFLTAPVLAFCQLVGLPSFDGDTIAYEEAEDIVSKFFSKWEVILSTTLKIDIVWAQVFSDPFLRRLILRFIFCRAVLSLFHTPEDRGQYTPVCLPELPSMVSPYADVVQSSVLQVADHFRVTNCFNKNL